MCIGAVQIKATFQHYKINEGATYSMSYMTAQVCVEILYKNTMVRRVSNEFYFVGIPIDIRLSTKLLVEIIVSDRNFDFDNRNWNSLSYR
jgi:hypothetical protein